ncbi:MAG: helix-turn-helix domain-containing protein [Candidatus Cryptobacteroides sp.]|nr:helix-turn-helix domain-containing protein [Candidatus Cryptobacteroides sp.]
MQNELRKTKVPDHEWFRQIDMVVRKEKLYAKPSLQRQDILQRFGLRRQHLNAILSKYAYGQYFPQYVNSMRLNEAERLMRENPKLSISAVAQAVGLSMPNLRIQFKQRFGLSPSDFRDSIQKK